MELGQAKASVRLDVNGYDDDEMWNVLPVPRPLDVETYKEYVAAAGRIQQTFHDHADKAFPVKLAENDGSLIADGGVNETAIREAVVLVGLLRRIRDEVPQDAAVASLAAVSDLAEDAVAKLGAGLYSTMGVKSDPESARAGAELAETLLYLLDRD